MKPNETQKQYPIEINEYYSPGLNSLKRIYTKHPKFNGNTRLIYEILFDYYNPDYGYAFPTHWDLARDSDLTRGSIIKQIKILEVLDLIEVRKSPMGDRKNNVYVVKAPVTTMAEFYAKFPDVSDQVKAKLAKIDAEEEALQKKWSQDKAKGKAYTKPDSPPEPEMVPTELPDDADEVNENWF
ncbi:hypothetical protein M3196_11895 [Fictibacillus nanhaiensis]|uniref:helix-turn-helix domain-containing protein n=1 Tax=Fictibacillus nanhaiensis TaxID=742169 RepID=UPI00203F29C4|nr:hypothetical protein [Fictibacillus nanhaiensis]MCM3732364.1 hypothetical protein [Fictibacillus nanhaiensis]